VGLSSSASHDLEGCPNSSWRLHDLMEGKMRDTEEERGLSRARMEVCLHTVRASMLGDGHLQSPGNESAQSINCCSSI